MTKWEYYAEACPVDREGNFTTIGIGGKPVTMNSLQYLNFLGAQGWELVNWDADKNLIQIVMKRPVTS